MNINFFGYIIIVDLGNMSILRVFEIERVCIIMNLVLYMNIWINIDYIYILNIYNKYIFICNFIMYMIII